MKALILGSDSSQGLSSIGLLICCWESELIHDIQLFVGSGIGALIAALALARYDWAEILEFVATSPVLNRGQSTLNEVEDEFALMLELRSKLIGALERRFLGSVPTMESLYRITGQSLIVLAINLSTGKLEQLSRDTVPTMPVADAVLLALSHPGYTYTSHFQDNIYTDASSTYPYPLFVAKEYANKYKQRLRAYGVTTAINYRLVDESTAEDAAREFTKRHLVSIEMDRAKGSEYLDCRHIIIELDSNDVHKLYSTGSPQIKTLLLMLGYQTASKFIGSGPSVDARKKTE